MVLSSSCNQFVKLLLMGYWWILSAIAELAVHQFILSPSRCRLPPLLPMEWWWKPGVISSQHHFWDSQSTNHQVLRSFGDIARRGDWYVKLEWIQFDELTSRDIPLWRVYLDLHALAQPSKQLSVCTVFPPCTVTPANKCWFVSSKISVFYESFIHFKFLSLVNIHAIELWGICWRINCVNRLIFILCQHQQLLLAVMLSFVTIVGPLYVWWCLRQYACL